MFKRRRRRNIKRRKPILKKLFGSIVAVVVLTAFVLGLAFSVKKISTLETSEAIKLTGPLLRKLGISEDKAGQVAGDFAERLFNTTIAPAQTNTSPNLDLYSNNESTDSSVGNATHREIVLKVAVMSDSAEDNESFIKALDLVKSREIDTVFYLGDFTAVGDVASLQKAKAILDNSDLQYYAIPGDHDIATSLDASNFHKVFGKMNSLVNFNGILFLLVDNSANETAIDIEKMSEYMTLIPGVDIVLMSQPLYHPQESVGKPVMGVINGEQFLPVKRQAEKLLSAIQNSDAKTIIAGDHHSFSKHPDLVKSDLTHYTTGSITTGSRGKKSFLILTVYTDATHEVKEVVF